MINRDENMKQYSFKISPSLLKDVEDKAGMVPVSRIIRVLLEKWVKGEIDVNHEGRIYQADKQKA